MKIISYNINGIRAALNKDLLTWIKASNANVICLQEIKAKDDQVNWQAVEDLGYYVYTHPAEKKGYSGVALLTREKPRDILIGIGEDEFDVEGRLLRADFGKFDVISTYMPSGASKPERQLFKLRWLRSFYEYLDSLKRQKKNVIIAGDFNICHKPIDIHNPYDLDGFPGFTEEERQWFDQMLDLGFTDSFRHYNPLPNNYTWWSYMGNARPRNLGWRIDYIVVSSALNEGISSVRHLTNAQHSDHCPVSLDIDLQP